MKKLYFLFFLTIGFFGNAQIVNIPDANFKAKLLSASPSNTVARFIDPVYNYEYYDAIDTNNNGEIEINEIEFITSLNLHYSGINNLTGIEFFNNLKSLNFADNNISGSFDANMFSELESLQCGNNNLTSLYVNGCLNLEYLEFPMNQVSTIDLTNLINLLDFNCGNNQISNLNLNNSTSLYSLKCYTNNLSSIDISNFPNLSLIQCGGNLFTELDFSNNPNLNYLECNYNPNLMILNIKNGSLHNTLNFSGCQNLEYICIDNVELSMISQKINDYGYTNCHINSYCSFTPGGTFYEISGNTKFDLNNNSCDVFDINYPNLNFLITDGTNTGSLIANHTGNYYIPVSAGNHTVTPNLENPTYFNISPTSFTANFPTQASPFTQDFCVTANGIKHDVEVVLIPTVPARPGFEATYKLVYRNKGNQIGNGNIILSFLHTVLDYVSSNPVYNSSSTSTFTWNYTNLQPFETREIEITFNVNSPMDSPPVNIGEPLGFSASIIPTDTDETPVDNNFSLNQIVVGSYDPNDKTCLEGGTIDTSMVGEYVHYVIRFENTGTYLAENIVVKDMIDISKFEVASLVPLHGSHDFYTRIKDNKVEFIFENINLDFDNATNDGYVAFKIKTLPTLTVGDTFSNEASIYFDYNFPIITNEYVTTFQNILLNNHDFSFENEFVLYPNPAKDVLNIQAKQDVQLNSIEIYNQLGQIVMAVTNAVNVIDVADLASGTYFVKVNTEKGSANTKFVKE